MSHIRLPRNKKEKISCTILWSKIPAKYHRVKKQRALGKLPLNPDSNDTLKTLSHFPAL